MAKFRMNKMVDSATGKVGNMVFRQVGRRTLYTQAPEREHVVTTVGQRAQRDRFKRAVSYARNCILDPVLKEAYEKRTGGKEFLTGFNVAVTDYLHAPKIDSVDLSGYTGQPGENLIAKVFETAKVVSAKVTIVLADDTLVEKGDANLIDSFNWQYVTTQVNSMLAGSKITFTIADSEDNIHTVVKTL
jgi:hypothetical protein